MADKKTPPAFNKCTYRLRNIATGEIREIKKILPYQKRVVMISTNLGGSGEDRTQRGRLDVADEPSELNLDPNQITKESPIGKVILKMEKNDSYERYITHKTATGKKTTYEILEKNRIQ